MNKRPMVLLSIVERDKGQKLIRELETLNIRINFQCGGIGTAPTEMMDIFGLGTKDKDIIISIGAENIVRDMMANFGSSFSSHSKYGGLMVVLSVSGTNRILTEILSFNNYTNSDKGRVAMKNENHNSLILIAVNEGYLDEVMKVARKAGATGGTVIKARLAEIEQFANITKAEVDTDREILCILAPNNAAKQIMEDVNAEFGITTEANGIILSLPTEKAYKI